MPDIALSTDIIVGFPDETDDEFQRTVELVRDIEFDFAFLFAYSEREGTFASKKIPDTVPEPVKKERLQHIIALQEAASGRRYAARVGSRVDVLVQGPSKRNPDQRFGKSGDFKTTVFDAVPGADAGSIVTVEVESASSHSLFGRAVAIDGVDVDARG